MKKNLKKMLTAICGGMFVLMCTACSMNEKSTTPDENNSQLIQNQSEIAKQSDIEGDSSDSSQEKDSADSLYYDGANLQGNVVEFSDSGFTLSVANVTKDEEGGEVMAEAAPGSENEDDLVTISYSENTTFEIVILDSASLTETSREATDKQAVKKQSSVLIFGSCQDTNHWTADKVTIIQWRK